MMKKIFISIVFILLGFTLFACSEVQNEYHEVHIIVVDDYLFFYVNPDEGKDTISLKYLDTYGTEFIYLYQPIDGQEFSYEHFFSTINNRFVETDFRNGKHYIKASEEIDNLIYRYYIDKESWVQNP